MKKFGRRCAKTATKLPLVEFILNESNEPQFAKITDLEMLVLSSYGRAHSGRMGKPIESKRFSTNEDHPTNSGVSVIEAVRAKSSELIWPLGLGKFYQFANLIRSE
jgi:hypothetical protein